MKRINIVSLAVLVVLTRALWAWGPHSEIMDAALSVLPAEDRLGERLGANAGDLRLLVWMGDWQNQFMPIHEEWGIGKKYSLDSGYYTNDYLLFPMAPRYYQHEVPDVIHTHEPFFLRTLQALRTETPANAARWMGSLMHFVTDTGSPPHAASISGEVHTKMENWIDASQIKLTGYHPTLLGKTDKEALDGFLKRMNGLIEFSRQRAERLRPLIDANDRRGSEPIELESAIESAKVAADTVHTLLVLSAHAPASETSNLYARIEAPSIPDMRAVSAKLVLLGTTYSTMSETLTVGPEGYQGTFQLRNLPPATYHAVVYRVGCSPLLVERLELKPGVDSVQEWKLTADRQPGNLVRNPDFQIRWSSNDRPEQWQYKSPKMGWVSDNIRINAGDKYRIVVDATRSGNAQVRLEWLRREWPQELGDPIVVSAGETHLTAPQNAAYARIVIVGREFPSSTVEHVALIKE